MPSHEKKANVSDASLERAAVKASPVPAVLLTSEFAITQSNRLFAELYGRSVAELKGANLLEFVHPEERSLLATRLTELLGGRPGDVRLNIRLARPQAIGSPALLLARRAGRGRRARILAYIVDLSDTVATVDDRIQLLDAIERALWEWRRTFDAVEMPILILSAEGTVARINQAARMLMGKPYREIIGQPVTRFESEPWQTIASLTRQVQETRSPVARQVKDGAGRTLDLLAMLFNADDPGDARVIVIVWDVTTLVDLQTRYEQQRTMATIGALVAGVAHEVRNPLFAISATLDAMEQSASGTLGEYFEVLREEIDRMSSLMRDLLAYGRPAAPQFAGVSASAVIGDAIRGCQAIAHKHGVGVETDIADDPTAMVDRERLVRAVQNLVENAIQHSPPGGVVTVRCSATSRGRTRYIHVRVTDEGRGFSAEDLPRVFEPFFSKRKGGTGLGLALVQQIVAEHGGEVFASNAAAGGAEVMLSIPLPR